MNEKGKVSGPKVAPLTEKRLRAIEGQFEHFPNGHLFRGWVAELVTEIRRLQAELSALMVKLNTTVSADTTEKRQANVSQHSS